MQTWNPNLLLCILSAVLVSVYAPIDFRAKCFIAWVIPFAFQYSAQSIKGMSIMKQLADRKVYRRLTTAVFELCTLLCFFYFCDRTEYIQKSPRKHSLTAFLLVCDIACIAAAASLCFFQKKSSQGYSPQVGILSRDQTEEWKGWMQLLILWYHYFQVHEVYPIIRVCIATYVWLTGFGNFRYFYATNDFSLRRLLRIIWRINFFPLCLCALFRNQWMLYYICALHTVFTLFVYATLACFSKKNSNPLFMKLKLLVAFLVAILLWDVLPRTYANSLWSPLKPVLQFQHLRGFHVNDCMHEWIFRSKLDHLAWAAGMVCAYYLPEIERVITYLQKSTFRQALTLASMGSTLTFYWWNVRHMDKFAYNRIHPIISIVPILSYIALRNLSKGAQQSSVPLFKRVGSISLECYVAQFHIWMATKVPNGSPHFILSPLAQAYHWMADFVLFSAIHFFCAYRIFRVTEILKDIVIPSTAPMK